MFKQQMKRVVVTALTVVLISGGALAGNLPMDEANAKQAAELIAAMFVAGLGVVAKHQGLINDPEKGDKGFTPEYVEGQIREQFKEMTGTELDAAQPDEVKAALMATLEASNQGVKNNQQRINRKGVEFKGFIPAVYGRVTGNILKGRTGIAVKQTTFQFRNAYNEPDEFESSILKKFEDGSISKGQGVGERVGDSYRYLRPVYIKEACLKCHGDPKGELDIAGKPKEGYKLGDLRGAISVQVPITK